MYGRYTKELGSYAKEEARKLEKKRRKAEEEALEDVKKYKSKWSRRVAWAVGLVWRQTFARLGEDWVFLALLGLIMAFLSFLMDHGISFCNKGKRNTSSYQIFF